MKLGANVDVEFRVGELLRCPLRAFPMSDPVGDDPVFEISHGEARVGVFD